MNSFKKIFLNKYIIICIIAFAIILLGGTYAYFAYRVEDTVAIRGNVVELSGAELEVTLIAGNDTEMVPLKNTKLYEAINGIGGQEACIDSNGRLSCQVYRITLTNEGPALDHLVGTIELYARDSSSAFENLKWRELTNPTTIDESGEIHGMPEDILVSNYTLGRNEVATFYIAIWIEEIDIDQTSIDYGHFGGTVKFEVDESINTYTIRYNANGGINAPPSQQKTPGVDLTLTMVEPTRNGYTFAGWNTNKNAQTATYQPGSSFSIDNSTTLFAIWTPNTYTINYNANGGSNAPASQTKTQDVDLTLSNNEPTKEGYNFQGWNTNQTATTIEYAKGATFSVNANTTLYAVWAPKTYTISYNANGGTGTPSSQTKTHNENLTLTTATPTKTGYNFLGWDTNQNATTATYAKGSTFTINANTTLYAIWELKTYTISYNANGGSNAPASQTKTHGVNLILQPEEPTRTGYTFLGWNTNSSATTAAYLKSGTFTINANTTLYAVWQRNTYTITYHANGGSNAPASQTKTYNVNLTLSSEEPTKTGYNFLGWDTNQNATTATYAKGSTFTTNANTTLYAIWSGKNYNVSFNAMGGNTTQTTKQVTYGSTYGTLEGATKSGYIFDGWYTESTGGTLITASSYVSISSDHTLYAHYTQEYDSTAPTAVLLTNINSGTSISASLTSIVEEGVGMRTTNPYGFAVTTTNSCTGASYTYGSNTSYTFTGLEPEHTYYVCAILYDNNNNSNTYISNDLFLTNADTTPPTTPTFTFQTGDDDDNLHIQNFVVTYHTTETGSGIDHWEHTYEENPTSSDWSTIPNSGALDYISTFTSEQDDVIYVRACDVAGNCSEAASLKVRISNKLYDHVYEAYKVGGEKTVSSFYSPTSADNQGVYRFTEDSTNVYYYRGTLANTNNNVIFNGFCWKIVRTTKTNGVKLVYNGMPSNGQCPGTNPTIGNSKYNNTYIGDQYAGYYYGTNNSTASTIAGIVNNWFSSNMTGLNDYLEDAIWCNDRSMATTSSFNAYARISNIPISPSLSCTNSADRFTVSSTNGNGALTYKVGLLTSDELILSGFGISSTVPISNPYLKISAHWWLMSPSAALLNQPHVMVANSSGKVGPSSGSGTGDAVNESHGVRPAISLAYISDLTGGDGTSTTPYIISSTAIEEQYTITFNANTGVCGTASITRASNSTYGELPSATKTGYSFIGWFTEETEGTQVSSSTQLVINANHVLYAHYVDDIAPTATMNATRVDSTTINVSLTNVQEEGVGLRSSDKYGFAVTTTNSCDSVSYTYTNNNSYNFSNLQSSNTYYACAIVYDANNNSNTYRSDGINLGSTDTTPPTAPTFNLSSGDDEDNLHIQSFNVTYNTTEEDSGVSHWQYSFEENPTSTDWITIPSSNSSSFLHTYSTEMDQYAKIRACDAAGNCSQASTLRVRISNKLYDHVYNKYIEDGSRTMSSFATPSSGQGVYKFTEDGTDVYYYRGTKTNTNNHVIFNGYCWLMVRTTKTSGVKLLYDGVPSNGTCSKTGSNQMISSGYFNSYTTTSADEKFVGYYYGTNNATAGTAATTVNQWFSTYMLGANSYLEDAVWCNDRSVGTCPTSISTAIRRNLTCYNSVLRVQNYDPSLTCANNTDKFTTSSSNGNGNLTYKVGMMTSDEGMLAGYSGDTANTTNYLNSSVSWWTMSPEYIYNALKPKIFIVVLNSDGEFDGDTFVTSVKSYGFEANETAYIRPMVSLAYASNLTGGNGTSSSPYTIS